MGDAFFPCIDFSIPLRAMFVHPMRDDSGRYGIRVHHRGRVMGWQCSDAWTADDVRAMSLAFRRTQLEEGT